MGVSLTPWDLSNHGAKPWPVIVIVLVVITWPSAGITVAAYADAIALASLLIAVGGSAAKDRKRSN
ncbi:hypothetical protein [Streptomyces xantholiticus]|uniref:hypothetical protein n=1 Tax=Streptomyces xantholiticus TaxID=68285 RepID=UPI0016744A7E|nr:hypothetical protein [Streptomyces xantholiticus]GGW45493.1 hypothetical protein GCM10010381_33320 [Streptomyces xantholiticus]